jgi:ubiquinone biosynthesis protein
MKIIEFFKFIKAVRRIRKVSFIFIKHGFYQFIITIGLSKLFIFRKYLKEAYHNAGLENVSPEVRLRFALEELGPTFIKLGQMLSQEISLLPAKYINELKKLQDSVQSNYLNFSEVKVIIKKETGKDVEEIFLSFEEIPIASASIAQVHRAFLKDGTEVAVKIKKSGVDKIISGDMDVLYFIVKIAKKPVEEFFYLENIDEIYNEFSKNIKGELDFLNEAGFAEKIYKSNLNKNNVVVPRIYWDFSTSSILIEEFINGIKISNKDEIIVKGYDTKNILRVLLNYFFNQFFKVGYFNADPHAGNIFVMDESKIGIIDYGLVGILTKDLRYKSLEYFINFIKGDYEAAASIFINICMAEITEREEQDFKYDLMKFIEGFSSRPFKDIYSAELLLDIIKIAKKHKIIVPYELSLLFKALLSIESIAKTLDPNFTFLSIDIDFFNYEELVSRKDKAKNIKDTIIGKLKNYGDFFSEFPRKAEKILKKMSEDNFSIDFIHKGLDGLIKEMEKSSKRLVLGLLLVALIISSAMLMFLGAQKAMGWMETMGTIGWILGMLYLLVLILKGLR